MMKRWMRMAAASLSCCILALHFGAYGETVEETVPAAAEETVATAVPPATAEVTTAPDTSATAEVTATPDTPAPAQSDPSPTGESTEVIAADPTPEASDLPAVSDPVTINVTPSVTEALPTSIPTAAPFEKGYVSLPSGTWFYVTRYADPAKHFFRVDGDSFGYAFDFRVNSQGELWAEVGFAIHQDGQLVLKVGYIPASQLTALGGQADPAWIAAAAAAPTAYYLLGEKADRPLPVTRLTFAPQQTEVPASSEIPAESASTPVPAPETPAPADAADTASDAGMASAPTATPAAPVGEDSQQMPEQDGQPASPDGTDDPSAHEHHAESSEAEALPSDSEQDTGENRITDADLASPSDIGATDRRVWIEVERPEDQLYRGDRVTLRAKAVGFDAAPVFQWEYRRAGESEWTLLVMDETQPTDTVTLEVDAANVTWAWRVIAK